MLIWFKTVYHCNQESEEARLNEEWCTLALKRLKEASPLALKVSLRSVSSKLYDLSCLPCAVV
jgi:3-hydroxyisobutyryl-CoA hydrolase